MPTSPHFANLPIQDRPPSATALMKLSFSAGNSLPGHKKRTAVAIWSIRIRRQRKSARKSKIQTASKIACKLKQVKNHINIIFSMQILLTRQMPSPPTSSIFIRQRCTSSVLSTHPSRPTLGIGTPASSVSSLLALPPAQPGCSAHGEALLARTRTQPDQLRSSLWAAHGMVAPARHSAGYLGKVRSLF